jgi:alpha-L-rhamnosidase
MTAAGRIAGDTQTGYLLGLAFDLLPVRWRKRAVSRPVYLIRKNGDRLATGFVGTPLLCPVLSRFGRDDLAFRLLNQRAYPSWLYPVVNGAATMWERWK